MEDEEGSTLSNLWAKRKAMIQRDPATQTSLTFYPDYPNREDEDVVEYCSRVNSQLAVYKGKRRGIFGRKFVMDSARTMPAHLWWDQNGASVPELQAFARSVLAQPASASII